MFHSDIMNVPPQKKSTSEKYKNDQEWFKQTIDAYENQALLHDGEAHRKMQVYYDLDNDIIDEAEIEKVFNPMGLSSASLPTSIRNYPISVPKIDLLQGEESKRRFDWSIRARNMDSESSDDTELLQMFMQIASEEIANENYSEEEAERRIKEFAKYAKYSWKSMNEVVATKILQYLWSQQHVQLKFNTGFRHALISGREIYRIDIEGGEPVGKVCDPRNVYPIRKGDSDNFDDAEAIVEITYEPLGSVIDSCYDYLKPSDIDELENGQLNGTNPNPNQVLNYNNKLPRIYSNIDFGSGPGFMDINEFQTENFKLGLPYDSEGNVRVVRVRWKGRRKIGKLTFIDENGDEQERIVSEYYKPDTDAGEHVKWIWINEAYEGVKIADCKYLKMQPREVQMRHLDNKSRCSLGYVGTDYGKSLMARMEPYQYLYNIYMGQMNLIMSKYKGPIYELDISKIPDEWEIDMWMYYADMLGWAVVDPMNEGKKGAAMGKLAGAFNTTGKVLDPQIGNYIQQVVMMLQYIENQMGEIAGVTKQRQGQVDNRETVGGVERAVTQSSHITEKWFFIHDETKKRFLSALLDTAKQCWSKNKSKKIRYVMDDMSRQFLEFNGEDIASTEFDLFATNSSKDMEIRDMIKQLSHAAVQNGSSLSLPIQVLRSDSISEMYNIIISEEDRIAEQSRATEDSRNEAIQNAAMIESADKEADRALKKYEIDINAELKRAELGIKQASAIEPPESNDDGSRQEELSLKRDQLSETIRHNKATESIQKSKPKSTK